MSRRRCSSCGNYGHNSRTCRDVMLFGVLIKTPIMKMSTTGEIKKGLKIKWTEKEHEYFLRGLEKLGKGKWIDISQQFVKSRTPTQVAGHAQKYYRHKRKPSATGKTRPSIFDMSLPHEDDNMEMVTYHQQLLVLPSPSETPTPLATLPPLVPIQETACLGLNQKNFMQMMLFPVSGSDLCN